jgi:peptide deformylase
MAVRNVLRMGDPTLLRVADPVREFATPALEALLIDMRDTMAAYNGAGLAAPQIGVPLQVVIFGVRNNPRYPQAEDVPSTILINPHLSEQSAEEQEDWEGCLSVPGLRGWVPRSRSIRYQGFDGAGNPIDRYASGFHARVVQHEVDHLRGILYPMRIRDFTRFGFIEELMPGTPISED